MLFINFNYLGSKMKSNRKIYIFQIIFLLSIFYSAISANWWLKGSAEQLNEKEFNQKVGKGEYHYVISYFTPWCQYCQQMAPEYNKLLLLRSQTVKKTKNFAKK
ncbi:Thioredoxin-like fold [Pseudocohnilembus persalinus]|uniref:Thioredoxin-like fold n=1 Tax=Pseudocohnilembus persalinus TaxID=266149 RepID=A0A0V0QDU4_PSEPJ|nr:Thioredoxin-like fold [Pseudocohnilembus persalinus]|eukprot:KRX00372.1 Thioredoxin-like fold [Pseudocohnilembus persalinus]